MHDFDLRKPQRQSAVGVGVIFFKNLRKAINIIFSILVVQFGFKTDASFLWIMIAVVLLLVLIVSILIYRKFLFYVEDDQFIIEKGLFGREKISIPFERIQSVHINQNIIQRVLKVVGLKIDTAGSEAKELEIAALPKEYARSIQEFLDEKRSLINSNKEDQEEDKNVESKTSANNTPIVQLSLRDVIKVGLTENHIRNSLTLFAIANGLIWQNQEYVFEYFQKYSENAHDIWLKHWIIITVVFFVALLLISIMISLIQSVFRFFGLRFFIDSKGVQSVSGLFRRTEYQIPINKIQFIKWSTNPFRKLVGISTLVIKQASSKATNDKLSLMVPGCNEQHLKNVMESFFPEMEDLPKTTFRANSFFKIQMALLFAIIPSVLIGVIGFVESGFYIISALWLLIALPISIKYAARMRLEVNSEVLCLKKGWLFPQVELFKYYKLQNVALKQNIFQKRRNLVHLDFYSAAGSLRMWQLDADVAKKLYDYILFKIEESNKSWM